MAFAKGKRLPVVVCAYKGRRLEPLALREDGAPLPPIGQGNAKTIDSIAVADFARSVAGYLRDVERAFGVAIQRVALDSPSSPKARGRGRRHAECELDRLHIRCITTPSQAEFEGIRERVSAHLEAGGAVSRLPHANQLWMLVGFELFRKLGEEWECLEVFPQATVCLLRANTQHKTRKDAVLAQLRAASRYTGWPSSPALDSLRGIGFGAPHDRSDAYLAAWVASLEPNDRKALGMAPDDVIWVPRVACEEALE